MLKAYKYRIYPNSTQRVLLAKTFGCVRYFWNKQVEAFNSYDAVNNQDPEFKTSKQLRDELAWMKEVSATALQQKQRDFDEFKKQRFNKSRKTQISNPTFKKRSNRQSYRLTNTRFSIRGNKIRLEKIGLVKIVLDRQIPEGAKYLSVTVSMNPAMQYFVSILVEREIRHLPKTNKTVGLDVGLREFVTQSDGVVVVNPRYFRDSQAKIKRIQRIYSRKVKGSNRRKKFRIRLSRLHNKVVNQRNWFLHNESIRIVREYDTICIEDLNVSGMLKNHCLAKSISDVSWSTFFVMLEYKSKWYGKELIKVGRFEPTSKTCSCCGWKNTEQTLSDRVFACPVCGLKIDRDLNAAINIQALGVNSAIRTSSGEVTSCVDASKGVSSSKIL